MWLCFFVSQVFLCVLSCLLGVWDKERVKTRKRIVKKPKVEVEVKEEIPAAASSCDKTMTRTTAVKVEIPDDIQELIDKVKVAYDKSHNVPQEQSQPKPQVSV